MIFYIIFIFACAVIGTISLVALRKNKQNTSLVDISGCRRKDVTRLGAVIYSANGVSDLFKATAEAALTRLFGIARSRGYSNKLNYPDYPIYVVPAVETRNGIPVFRLRADAYDGSVYDQNPQPGIGEVLAPEYVLPDRSGFVVAATEDMNLLKELVHNGAEHILLFYNDRTLFEATAIHTDTQGHPILS